MSELSPENVISSLAAELERVRRDRRAWRIAAFASLVVTLLVAIGLPASGVCHG